MEVWLILAIAAQFIYALVAVFDKYLVTSKTVLHPFSYAFYVSILSAFSVGIFFFDWVKLPFGIVIPSFSDLMMPSVAVVGLSLLSGMAMFVALVNLFEGLSKSDASDVVPVVTSISAMATLAFEFLFLEGVFNGQKLLGFFLLAAGTVLVSHLKFDRVVIFHTFMSGAMFAVYYTLLKFVFNVTNFDSGFLYTRIGLVIAALAVIAFPSYRTRIFRKLQNRPVSKRKAGAYVLATKTLAGIASIMTLKAVQLGSVAVVQAIAGVQFLLLIVFSAVFGKIVHEHFGEKAAPVDIIHKGVAATIIALGLFVMFT